jgi:hypothetical protein
MATDSAAAAMDVNNPDILDTGFLPMSRYSDVGHHGPWWLDVKSLPPRDRLAPS